MIETRLLYYFLAIAREQNITKAAKTLHISQPTLSKQMMDLENQLGKQLLIRGKKRITLTEEGLYLRSRAQEMIDLMEKTESAFHNEKSLVVGDIYFGCGETPIMKYITEIFKKINIEYPGIKFHIYSGDAEAILERLDKGLLDIGLLLGPIKQDKYNYTPINKNDSFGILVPKDCSLAQKKSVSIKDLTDLPLIFPQQTVNGQQFLEWFGTQYSTLNIISTYNLLYNATFMVEQGIGYAFCLANLVDTTTDRNLTFLPINPSITVESYIVSKKYQTFSTAVKVFLDLLKNSLE